MQRHLLRWSRAAAAAMVAVAAVWAGAAPMMLGRRHEVPEEAYTLANLTRFTLKVESVSPYLDDHGVSAVRIEQWLRDRLRELQFEVAADPTLPEVVVQATVALDDRHKDAVAVALVLAVHQPVRVERLDRVLRAPTSSMSLLLLIDGAEVEERLRQMVRAVADGFRQVVRMASVE